MVQKSIRLWLASIILPKDWVIIDKFNLDELLEVDVVPVYVLIDKVEPHMENAYIAEVDTMH